MGLLSFLFFTEISFMKTITFTYTHHPFQRDANVITRTDPLNPDKGLEALKNKHTKPKPEVLPSTRPPPKPPCAHYNPAKVDLKANNIFFQKDQGYRLIQRTRKKQNDRCTTQRGKNGGPCGPVTSGLEDAWSAVRMTFHKETPQIVSPPFYLLCF